MAVGGTPLGAEPDAAPTGAPAPGAAARAACGTLLALVRGTSAVRSSSSGT